MLSAKRWLQKNKKLHRDLNGGLNGAMFHGRERKSSYVSISPKDQSQNLTINRVWVVGLAHPRLSLAISPCVRFIDNDNKLPFYNGIIQFNKDLEVLVTAKTLIRAGANVDKTYFFRLVPTEKYQLDNGALAAMFETDKILNALENKKKGLIGQSIGRQQKNRFKVASESIKKAILKIEQEANKTKLIP